MAGQQPWPSAVSVWVVNSTALLVWRGLPASQPALTAQHIPAGALARTHYTVWATVILSGQRLWWALSGSAVPVLVQCIPVHAHRYYIL